MKEVAALRSRDARSPRMLRAPFDRQYRKIGPAVESSAAAYQPTASRSGAGTTWNRFGNPTDRSVRIRAAQWPSRLPAVEPTSLLYSYGSLQGGHSFFNDAGPAPMRHSHIRARPASTKNPKPARSRARNSKGAMPALALQPGGPFGRMDAHGEIRWISGAVQMPLQFKCRCSSGADRPVQNPVLHTLTSRRPRASGNASRLE